MIRLFEWRSNKPQMTGCKGSDFRVEAMFGGFTGQGPVSTPAQGVRQTKGDLRNAEDRIAKAPLDCLAFYRSNLSPRIPMNHTLVYFRILVQPDLG